LSHLFVFATRYSLIVLSFSSIPLPPPTPTLFPYTTLFRSKASASVADPRSLGAVQVRSLYGNSRQQRSQVMKRSMINDFNVEHEDRKSTRLNSSHVSISYAVFCLKKKINKINDI